jgi:hypothetical protein
VKARFLEVVTGVLAREAEAAAGSVTSPDSARQEYVATVSRVRDVVQRIVPADSTLLVVSKGDADLVRFSDRTAWHFPRNGANGYAGYYPADSAGASQHLELMRTQGAQFMVFPRSARWWLSHYSDFKAHLDETGRVIWSDEDCEIYQLDLGSASRADAQRIAPAANGNQAAI